MLTALPVQFDESVAAGFRSVLLAAVERRPRVLIADLSQTRWCDWAGAGTLASVFRRAAAAGTELRLVLTDETVRKVLRINGLDQVIPVYASVAAAARGPATGGLS